jgi:hypothetical protein
LSARASTAEPQGSARHTDKLLPIADASERLQISPWALKRMHKAGNLPAVIANSRWFVPESFVAMVFASPRPKQAGVIEQVAAEWFASHATSEAVA